MSSYEERTTYKKVKKPHRLQVGTKLRIILPIKCDLVHRFQKSCCDNVFILTRIDDADFGIEALEGDDTWILSFSLLKDQNLEVHKAVTTFIRIPDRMETLVL